MMGIGLDLEDAQKYQTTETSRREKAKVWLQAYSANVVAKEVQVDAVYHADRCLEAYESRFMKKED